jgi:hypothetical protein
MTEVYKNYDYLNEDADNFKRCPWPANIFRPTPRFVSSEKDSFSRRTYQCCWIAIEDLPGMELVPPEMKELISFWLKQDLDALFKSSFSDETPYAILRV